MIHFFVGGPYGVNLLDLEDHLEESVRAFLGPRADDPFARELIFADDTQNSTPPVERLMAALQGADLFGGADKAVILRNGDALPAAATQELLPFLEREFASCNLFVEMQNSHVDKKGKLQSPLAKKTPAKKAPTGRADWGFLEKSAKWHSHENPPEWKMTEWLEKRALKRGLKLRRDQAQFFIETVGPHTGSLDAELVKLRILHGEGAELTHSILDQGLSRSAEGALNAVVDAFGKRDRETFMLQLRKSVGADSDMMGALMALFYHSSHLLRVAEMRRDKVAPETIAAQSGFSPFAFKNRELMRQASLRSPAVWKRTLHRLAECIADIPQGRLSDRVEFELRLLALFPLG